MIFILLSALLFLLIKDVKIKRTSLMCDPTGGVATMMIVSGVAGGFQAFSQYQQGVAQSKYYSAMQKSKEQQAQYDLAIGAKQGELIEDTGSIESKQLGIKQAEQNAASQASSAARGIEGGTTAEEVNLSNLTKEQLDQDLIKYNSAVKEWGVNEQAKGDAWAANVEAAQYGAASKNAKIAGRNQAIGTILGTAASIGTQGWLAGMGGGGGTSLSSKVSGFGGGTNVAKVPAGGWGSFSPDKFLIK